MEENIADKSKAIEPKNLTDYNYARFDVITLFITMVIGYLYIRRVLFAPYSLYAMIFNLLFLTICVFYTKYRIKKHTLSVNFLLVLAAFFNATFIITDNPLPKMLSGIFSFFLTSYVLFLITSGREAFERVFLSVFCHAVAVIPLRGFQAAPKFIKKLLEKTGKTKKVWQITAGAALGIPLTLVVAALLISADDGYRDLLSSILDTVNINSLINFIIKLLFSLPVSFYLFGMLYANVKHNNSVKTIDPKVFRIAPSFMLYSSVTPVCILYILFFFNQLTYFTGAFGGILPDGFSYSQYARQGFFELCAVSVINAGLILIMNLICKKSDGEKQIGLSIYSVVIAFFTILLITTAISKMVMYINQYGLSPLRVYTSWFMLLLMPSFAIAAVWGLILNKNIYKPIFAVFTVMLGLLCFVDIDGMIIKYNIEMYKNGTLNELDVSLFYDLSDSAVKHAFVLENDPVYGGEIRTYLEYKKDEIILDFGNWNIQSIKAKWLLDRV